MVWYTIETAEIRKQGEQRADIEAEPVVGFHLEERPVERQPSVWFCVRNYSRNPATMLVRVRLRTAAGLGEYRAGPYSGNDEWNLEEFRYFQGWIDLISLVGSVQDESMQMLGQQLAGEQPRVTWPAKSTMHLDVQVGVYNAKGCLGRSLHQEFRIEWPSQDAKFSFWPEISPSTIEPIEWPDRIRNGNSSAARAGQIVH